MFKYMTRRQARELAFELIFEWEFCGETVDEMVELATEARDIEIDEFTLELVSGVILHIKEIDDLIFSHSHKWKKGRTSVAALSVLRLAVYEMKFVENIPISVSINEAVNLGKAYGDVKDSSYINGVLSAIEKKYCTGEKA